MSKINDLIDKICTKGVPFYKLSELVEFRNGKGHEKNIVDDGQYIVVNSKFISTDGEVKKYSDKQISPLFVNDILMVMSDLPNGRALAKCYLIDEDNKYTLNQRIGAFQVKRKDLIDVKYLFYYLNRNIQLMKYDNGVDQTNLRKDDILNIEIAVPPLEAQCEIVHILDDFTLLSAELSAELKARQKQFNYYREKLITKCDGTLYKLEDIVEIYLGLTHTPNYVENGVKFISAQNTSKDYLDLENVKYISEEEYNSITDNAKPKRNDVLFTRVGSNLGHPVIVETDERLCIFVSLGFLRVKDNSLVSNKYIKHWLNTEDFWKQVRKNVHGSAKVNLNTGWLKNFEIKIPSLDEQNKITKQLDKLESISNDIVNGLPAEIEARRKQYEYYKNILLSFNKMEVDDE